MRNLRKCIESQASEDTSLTLICSEKAEVKVDFLFAMASSKLVRMKLTHAAFFHEKDLEAIAMMRESFHLFAVVDPKAFFGALAAK